MQNKHDSRDRNVSASLFFALSSRKLLNWVPDRPYLSAMWRAYFHQRLDWKNPRSFNEKIQWLKAKDHNPLYPTLVDKFAVRQFIENTIGDRYLIPLVGGPWNSFDEIDFDRLPRQFVLKCTHDSGGVVICRDKGALDLDAARQKIEKSLRRNYYWGGREWPYQNIPPRIIAEAYMADGSDDELRDYKFYMFGGTARCILVCTNRSAKSKMHMTFFSPDWKRLPFERQYANDPRELPKPERFEEMLLLAEQLSADLPFARIDLYETDHKVYFGEITLHPASGLGKFQPVEWDYRLGEWIDLHKYFPKEFE
ncbi:MAG: glycosyl transferase [Clostridiales bacterium]|nr:glycosyl transferase [Clostridiales bacterium]